MGRVDHASASRTRLERPVAPLETLSLWWLGTTVAPTGLTLLVVMAGYVVSGGTDSGLPPQFPTFVYGIDSLAVVGVVGWPLTTIVADGDGVTRYTPPSITTTTGLVTLGFGAVLVALSPVPSLYAV